MAAVAAEIPDEFGPGPIEGSVLRALKEHRSCAVWERLLRKVDQGLPDGAAEVVVHQYAWCYILALLGDTIFADKSGDRVYTMWLQMLRDLNNPSRATDRDASQIGGALILVQYWAWVRFPFLCPRMDLPPDDAYGPPVAPSPLSIKTVWVVSTKNSPAKICLIRYRQLLDSMLPNQCGNHMKLNEATCLRSMSQEGMRGQRGCRLDKHLGHIQVWNSRAQSICHGARLEGDISPAHQYFGWYDRVTWRFVDHTTIAVLIMVASHKQMLTRYTVGSPEYKQITTVLKVVDRLHRITAQLPLEDAEGANPEALEDTVRLSTSSTPASHSHGQRAAPHQVVSRPDPLPPLHASPAPEFPPPPYASLSLEFPPSPHPSPTPEFPPPPHESPSLEIPPRTAYAVPDLEIPLPSTHASSHSEIPLPTPRIVSDPAHLSLTLPSFDLGIDFNQTPPVMHTQSPSYSIGHIDHVPFHSDSMSFMPTPGLHTDPMITGLTHISFATPSFPAVVGSSVVGSQAKQPDVHVEHEQQREEPEQGDAIPPPPHTRHYTRQHKRMRGVAPLQAAVRKPQNSSEHLTTLHQEFLLLSLLAKCYKIGLSILEEDIFEVDQLRDLFLYCYYGGAALWMCFRGKCGWRGNTRSYKSITYAIWIFIGSGKKTFLHRLVCHTQASNIRGYVMNLDPAVMTLPFGANIDIRHTVKYKEVMKLYNLGPNGGILTSLNLFAMKYAAVFGAFVAGMACLFGNEFSAKLMASLAKCFEDEYHKEDNLSLPNITLLLSYLYIFGVCSSSKFRQLIHVNSTQSLAFVLDEFYKNLRSVRVSAVSGSGVDAFFKAIEASAEEYMETYKYCLNLIDVLLAFLLQFYCLAILLLP
ncbi:hypothetical protein SO802_033903 [Lithocarpus litseifolius]|uniref:COP9 signalosome complex subunit 3 N-terminal helical repeats domain-containing protein n=1 Tax=Lithocarpus litseifolius TaxID=425828 RepID=A0AAW2BG21_9ROSI